MENRQLERTKERLASYNLFSYLFLALPNEEFVQKIFNVQLDKIVNDQSQRGIRLILEYITNSRIKTLAAVLQELAIDRTQLLRGLTQDGPRPPYESLYRRKSPQETISSLNTFYARENYGVSQDIHESSEYIGVELSFMRELCAKELTALQEKESEQEIDTINRLQQDFLDQHLGKWAGLFGEEMIEYAKTDFYRGVGFLLKDFMAEEIRS